MIVAGCADGERLESVLEGISKGGYADEIILVQDFPAEDAAAVAEVCRKYRVHVVRPGKRGGIGGALNAGLAAALGEIIVFMDGAPGFEETAARLVEEIRGGADVALASYPQGAGGNLEVASRLARWGVSRVCGFRCHSTFFGIRALRRRALEAVYPLRSDGGADVALVVDAVRAGLKVVETPLEGVSPGGRSGFYARTVRAIGQVSAVSGAVCRYSLPAPGQYLKRKRRTAREEESPEEMREDLPGEKELMEEEEQGFDSK